MTSSDIPGFQCFVDYISIKLHFNNPKFVWSKNSKYSKLKPDSFHNRKDRTFFIKLETKYSRRTDWIELFISGFLWNPSLWIGDLNHEEVQDYHQERLARLGRFESQFTQDCDRLEFYLFEHNLKFSELLTDTSSDPMLCKLFVMKQISLETLAVLQYYTGWMDSWEPANPLQTERKFRLQKYLLVLDLENRNTEKLTNTYHTLARI